MIYKKSLFCLILLSLIGINIVSAQDKEPILTSYKRNFVRSNLASKAGILRDASTDEKASDFMGPLYEFALTFVLQYADILQDDPDMINLTVIASRGIGQTGYKSGTDLLWKIFLTYKDSVTRVEALKGLAVLGKGSPVVVDNLNQYLANQNNLYRSGMVPDYPTLSAGISALGNLGDGGSFPVLFSAMIAGYPEYITQEAAKAMSSLQGDYKMFLITVIKNNPPKEKLAAFNAGLRTEKLSSDDLGELAETALTVTMEPSFFNTEGEAVLTELRYASVRQLTKLKWTRAVGLAIKNFYRVQEDYSSGKAPKEQLVEAIKCLGAMASPEAAQNLALQLGLLNSQMERTGDFDEAITIAIINALGDTGDKISFDYLLYVSYLSYPETVQNAARDALNKLKW